MQPSQKACKMWHWKRTANGSIRIERFIFLDHIAPSDFNEGVVGKRGGYMKNLHDMAIKKVVKAACSLTESLEQYKINRILLCVACRDTGECLILQSNAWAMLGCTYKQKGNLRLKDFRSQHKFCCKKKKKSARSNADGTLTTKKNFRYPAHIR